MRRRVFLFVLAIPEIDIYNPAKRQFYTGEVMVAEVRRFQAEILEVRSGDDLIAMVALGIDDLHKKVRVRLAGVDTPDAFQEGASTDAGRIRDKVKSLIKGKKCTLEVLSTRRGGWRSTLLLTDSSGKTVNVNTMLQEMGYVYRTGDIK